MPARRLVSFPKDTVLFRPAQDCPGLLLLDRGTIRVTLTAANGREVVLYRVGPGDMCLQTFACLVEGTPYGAEGVAETDLEGELIPPDAFRSRLDTDPGFRNLVFASVARRFAEYERLVEDVALTGFDARLARVLLRQALPDGMVQASHSALATETASGRAFVSRRMADLARQGIVEQLRGGARIRDRAALERIAAGER